MMIATRGLSYPSTRSCVRPAMPARMLALVQPESVFLNQVVGLARLYGWRYYHTFDSRKSVPGFPDLVLVRDDGRQIFAELKVRGRPTDVQLEWLDALRAVPSNEVYLWFPRDLPIIAAILRRRTT